VSVGPLVAADVAALPAAFLTYVFHWRFRAFRDCIATALSSCEAAYPDRTTEPLTHDGVVWGMLAPPFWMAAAWLALGGLRQRARP
jgi:hypothetical protein